MNKFGSRLRFLRNRKQLTQEKLGEILKISKSTVGMYERGHREPSFETLKSIAEYFEISIDYLLDHHIDKEHITIPTLTQEEEQVLKLLQEYPVLFEKILNASPLEINKLLKILKIISNE